MIEKVNPKHPDKVCDRIAGAIVDLAYTKEKDPKIAVEVLIGHGNGQVIIETSADIDKIEVAEIIDRIAGDIHSYIDIVPQDVHLSENQQDAIRCGDNGIFKGIPLTEEQKQLSQIAHDIYEKYIAEIWRLPLSRNGLEQKSCRKSLIVPVFSLKRVPSRNL